jgi:hypothetical protein
MLPQRVAVAAVGIPVIIGLTLLGGPVFAIVAGFVLTFAALEFYVTTDPELATAAPSHSLRDQRLPGLRAPPASPSSSPPRITASTGGRAPSPSPSSCPSCR